MGKVHGINFFKSALARLHQEKVYDNGCEEVASRKDVAKAEVDVMNDEWREEGCTVLLATRY
jgi:hypothetical protein